MKLYDFPVVMLAAGISKRFNPEHRTTPKSLLQIDHETRIFDLILNGLIQNTVSQVYVILGYKSNEFMQYLQNKKFSNMKNLQLNTILAGKDYVKGPIFTLLSYLPELDENIGNFVVLPSDTIFHPSILTQIFSYEVDHVKNQCFLFSVQLSDASISQMNQKISFTPQIIRQSSVLHSLIEEDTSHNMKDYYIPILISSRSFLEFNNNRESQISGKIIQNIEKYHEVTGNCHVIRLKYDLDIPPFLDIDTSYIYNTLNRVKKELLEPYKVK